MRPETAMDVPPCFSNHLLASLRPCDLAALRTHLTDIELPQETVLFEPGDTMSRVYFPLSGIVSLVVDLTSGQVIETAMIGREGMVGGSSVPHAPLSLNRAVVQVAGVAAMVPIEAIRDLAEQSASFREIMGRHQEHLVAQAQQSTACNVAHPIEARLSRWLLRCRDLLESNDISLTQEFLAEMLGVRRTSVTLVAHALQQTGFIRYKQGHIHILDVEGLREVACECYETLRTHSERLLAFEAHES
jgi:CRP-like cAMP-binding protein